MLETTGSIFKICIKIQQSSEQQNILIKGLFFSIEMSWPSPMISST